MGKLELLAALEQARDQGKISRDDFEREKMKILYSDLDHERDLEAAAGTDNFVAWWCFCQCCPSPFDVCSGGCKDDKYKKKKRMSWAAVMVAVVTWVTLALPISLTCSAVDQQTELCEKILVEGFPGEEGGKDGDYRLQPEEDDGAPLRSRYYMRDRRVKGFTEAMPSGPTKTPGTS